MDINSLIGTLLSSDSVSGVSKATKAYYGDPEGARTLDLQRDRLAL